MSPKDTSTYSSWEFLADSTVAQILLNGPITSSSLCCSFTKFVSDVISKWFLFSRSNSLMKSSIFLGGWTFLGIGFLFIILSCNTFSGVYKENCSLAYLAKLSGKFHWNFSSYSWSGFSLSLSFSSGCFLFLEGIFLAASSKAEYPGNCCSFCEPSSVTLACKVSLLNWETPPW